MDTWVETAQISAIMVVEEATMAEVVEEVEAMAGTPIMEEEVAEEEEEVAEEMVMRAKRPEDATTAIKLDTSRKTVGN